jgi:hypothetical protein
MWVVVVALTVSDRAGCRDAKTSAVVSDRRTGLRIIDASTNADVTTFADKGYQGARGSVRTSFKRRRFRPKLSRRQKAVNRAHAKIRACGERATATLMTWKVLAKLRYCPRRATAMVQAILVPRRSGGRRNVLRPSRCTGRLMP